MNLKESKGNVCEKVCEERGSEISSVATLESKKTKEIIFKRVTLFNEWLLHQCCEGRYKWTLGDYCLATLDCSAQTKPVRNPVSKSR